MNLIINLIESLTPYGGYSYVIMFGILIACGFGFPMPEDVVLITGGILASRGVTEFGLVFLVCMFGVLIGDGMIFLTGYHFGASVRDTRFFRWLIPKDREEKVMGWFAKYGDKVIFFARFAPGLRMPLFMTSGIYRVPPWKFFLLDGFAAIISVPVWIWVGYVFGANLEALEGVMRKMQIGLYGLLGFILLGFLVHWLVKRTVHSRL